MKHCEEKIEHTKGKLRSIYHKKQQQSTTTLKMWGNKQNKLLKLYIIQLILCNQEILPNHKS